MGVFDFLKNKNSTLAQSKYVCDIHSHLIPGIDDGVKTLEEAVDLIRDLHASGIKRIVTTPHIRGEIYENTPEIIMAGLQKVKTVLAEENIPVDMYAAAEYFIDDYFIHSLRDNIPFMTFSKDNHILVEFSHYSPPLNYKTIIYDLQLAGYTVVLAHPERYLYLHKKFDTYKDLYNRGVQYQLNLVSLVGYYDQMSLRTADKLIDAGMYTFVGSDVHNKFYMQACKKALRTKSYEKLFDKCNIMNDQIEMIRVVSENIT